MVVLANTPTEKATACFHFGHSRTKQSTKKKDKSLSATRGSDSSKHRQITAVGKDLMEREARRAQIEERLNRIRAIWKSEEAANCYDDTREEESGRLAAEGSELVRESSEPSPSSTSSGKIKRQVFLKIVEEHSNSGEIKRQEKVSKIVEEHQTRREQVRNLSAALQEKEKVICQLRKDVDGYQRETEECNNSVQENLQKQRQATHDKEELANYYEFKLQIREKEMEDLKSELKAVRRKASEVELQLEIHDFKFSAYEDYRRHIDKQALAKIGEALVSTESHDSSEDGDQYYIKKLINDLDEMEQLYVTSMIDSADKISTLEQECYEAREKMDSLERSLENHQNTNSHFVDNMVYNETLESVDRALATMDANKIGFLNKRIQILEVANRKFSKDKKVSKAELESLKVLNEKMAGKAKQETTSLRLENGALINKLSALEIEMGLSTGNLDSTIRSKRYKMLEKNLDDYIVEIMRLEEQLRMKERIISRLSCQAVENCLNPNLEGNPPRDRVIAACPKSPDSSWIEDDQRTKATADETEASSISELQSQLSEMQGQLNKKDETLNYVRAQYSARLCKLKFQADRRFQRVTNADLYFI